MTRASEGACANKGGPEAPGLLVSEKSSSGLTSPQTRFLISAVEPEWRQSARCGDTRRYHLIRRPRFGGLCVAHRPPYVRGLEQHTDPRSHPSARHWGSGCLPASCQHVSLSCHGFVVVAPPRPPFLYTFSRHNVPFSQLSRRQVTASTAKSTLHSRFPRGIGCLERLPRIYGSC